MNASQITKRFSWFNFWGKNLHLVGCATVCIKSEVILLLVCRKIHSKSLSIVSLFLSLKLSFSISRSCLHLPWVHRAYGKLQRAWRGKSHFFHFNINRTRAIIIYVLNKEILQFLGLKSAVYSQERFQIKSGL